MKKLLTLLAFALVTFTVDAQSTQKGDINGDGDISVNDVAMIVNYILGITDSNFIIANADVNGDGEIDINDVMGTVSIILGDNQPQVYLTCPDDHHPHLIDLGLPSGTQWACCNVDDDHSKQSPTNYGSHYAWGEVQEKEEYNNVTYIYATGEDEDGDGWYDEALEYEIIGNYMGVEDVYGRDIYDIAGTQYDVAHVQWGGHWVMPSLDQIEELLDNCPSEWTTLNGVNGRRFTGNNGGTIFLPSAGYRYGDFHYNYHGCYWSSTTNPLGSFIAHSLLFTSNIVEWRHEEFDHGLTVRPVWLP